MLRSKIETARSLAKKHFAVEPDLKKVFLLAPADGKGNSEPIVLLEIVEGTMETPFEPVAFTADPARGIEYPSMIIEISPRQFGEIQGDTILVADHKWKISQELHAA